MKLARSLDAGPRGFADGLLVELVGALREMNDGELVSLTSTRAATGPELLAWSKVTGHAIVTTTTTTTSSGVSHVWVVRKGEGVFGAEPSRPIGTRIWIYTNFDCNLRCDYCCVRSSPVAERRALGLASIRRVAEEARMLAVDGFYLTGGEPFLLVDIREIVETCASVAETTLLTNAMLFQGPRLERLRALPRDRVTLQVSVDSPTPALHDLHRGAGSWKKAMAGVRLARELGFRVRLAATVDTDEDERSFRSFLDAEDVAEEDRVIRRLAQRGFAEGGVALARGDLVPEVTLTANGVYWHPVGADDQDFFIQRDLFPLAGAIAAVREQWEREREHHDQLASVFHCA